MPSYWSDEPGHRPRRRDGDRPRSFPGSGRVVAATLILLIVVVISVRLALVALIDAPAGPGVPTLLSRPSAAPTDPEPAAAVAGAGPSPAATAIPSLTPQPRTFRLAVEQGLYDAFATPLDALDRTHENVIVLPYVPHTTPEDLLTQRLADGVVFWTNEPLPYGMPLAEIPYALVVHPQIDRSGFSVPQLVAIAEGLDETYTFVVPSDDRLVRALLDLDYLGLSVVRVDSWADVVAYVASHEDALGIVPWDLVDHRVRPVLVDGHRADPAETTGYPFCRRIWLLESSAMLMPAEALHDLRRDLAYGADPSVVLVVVGDVMLGGYCGERIAEDGPRYPFEGEGVWSLLSGAEITLGNLACALSHRGELTAGLTSYRADPASVEGLVYAGFDALSLANEHTPAYGAEALLDTMHVLHEAGIVTVGAGEDREQAYEPVILERDGLRVALLAFNLVGSEDFAATADKPGVAWLDDTWALRAIRDAREKADLVIVSCHWGQMHASEAAQGQTAAAEALLQAGADLIIGHHPHVVQAMSYQDNGVVAYSLGDLIYHPWSDPSSALGLALRCILDSRGVKSVELVPYRVVHCQPYLLQGEEAAAAISHVSALPVASEGP